MHFAGTSLRNRVARRSSPRLGPPFRGLLSDLAGCSRVCHLPCLWCLVSLDLTFITGIMLRPELQVAGFTGSLVMRALSLVFAVIFTAVTLSHSQSSSASSEAAFDRPPKGLDSFPKLLEKAQGGDPVAQCWLAIAYESGQQTERSYSAAVHWYRVAADHGNPAAQNNLGSMYARGLGVRKDDSEAAKWYLRAAGEGHPAAENNVGFIYGMGRGVPQSDEAAVSWYLRAASRRYAPAQTNLGLMYSAGRGVPRT
jgi:hypothetical protein